MATVTKGRTFVSGETVTPAKLNELVDNATVTSIAVADLASATTERLLPAGAIMPFAMNSAPSGWLAANGDAVSRSTYATLFAAIGTAHGSGDGSTTFNLPDLRGIFVRGSDSQTISGTTYSGTFAAKQQDEFKAHTHVQNYSNVGSGGSGVGVGGVAGYAGQVASNLITGSSGGTETRPANIALLYCIKF